MAKHFYFHSPPPFCFRHPRMPKSKDPVQSPFQQKSLLRLLLSVIIAKKIKGKRLRKAIDNGTLQCKMGDAWNLLTEALGSKDRVLETARLSGVETVAERQAREMESTMKLLTLAMYQSKQKKNNRALPLV